MRVLKLPNGSPVDAYGCKFCYVVFNHTNTKTPQASELGEAPPPTHTQSERERSMIKFDPII